MKKTILFGMLSLFSLASIIQAVSAYNPDGTEITFSARDGVYSRDYVYADTYSGYPIYRIYTDNNYPTQYNSYPDYSLSNYYYGNNYPTQYNSYPDYSLSNYYYGNNYNSRFKYYSLSDLKKFAIRQSAKNFIDNSAYSRYDINYGRDSEVFCDTADCKNTNPSTSNWRYKYTYDPRIDGKGSYENYYYLPQYDSTKGAYNWRY